MPRRKKAPPPPSLLVVHFDADKLRAQNLHLGTPAAVAGTLASVGFNASVETIDVRTPADLDALLGNLARSNRRFDVVVAIAHSNAANVAVAPGLVLPWDQFATWMKPLGPKRLLLVACEAGRWPAAEVLFTKLPTLRRIYASPVRASKGLGAFMLAIAPHVLAVKVPSRERVLLAQAAALLLGGQLREWKRDSDRANPNGAVLDTISVAADPYVRRVPSVVRNLLRQR